MKCGATSTMGQYKDGVGSFWKPFEIYKHKDTKKDILEEEEEYA